MGSAADSSAQNEAMWREVLLHGHRHRLAILPGAPRCTVCRVPFQGVGGIVSAMAGLRPSRKNPNFCNFWDEHLPPGGAEIDIAVLFADVRGSTTLGEQLGPNAFAALLNRFYRVATSALLRHEAMIDKLVGDEVMALFFPAHSGPAYRQVAVRAAVALLEGVGYGRGEPWLPVGVSVHAGIAFLGRVGDKDIHDFTALGDTVNTAARLQGQAQPGELLLSAEVYRDVADEYPNLEERVLTLRGKEEPLTAYVLRPGG